MHMHIEEGVFRVCFCTELLRIALKLLFLISWGRGRATVHLAFKRFMLRLHCDFVRRCRVVSRNRIGSKQIYCLHMCIYTARSRTLRRSCDVGRRHGHVRGAQLLLTSPPPSSFIPCLTKTKSKPPPLHVAVTPLCMKDLTSNTYICSTKDRALKDDTAD